MKVFESFVRIIKNYSITMASLGQILNDKIGKGGKSKAYVAGELGVSERTIENYMKGLRNPKPDAMVKLSKILKFDLSQLAEQNVSTTAPQTTQNGKVVEMEPEYSKIGVLVNRIIYGSGNKLTIGDIAERIGKSRPHLTLVMKKGYTKEDSPKILLALETQFAKELSITDKLTTTTPKPNYGMNSNGSSTKDAVIHSQQETVKTLADTSKSQQETISKLTDLVTKLVKS